VEALSVPTPEPMLQVTPAMAESFATVAVKACVPPPLSDMLAGLILTLIGLSVMVAVAVFVLSVMLVAVSVTVVVALTVVCAV
jgi:hypothetical protein